MTKIVGSGNARRIYPGGNTSLGFFSYYEYILGQREAERIVCIKGGPGVGKSTFMQKIGEAALLQGENVDFMHCSSDDDSLDGIVLKKRKIAYIDATSPHVVDPLNPGAVDSIINLGEFWDEKGIRSKKADIINAGQNIKEHFKSAYNFLGAAGKVYDNLTDIYKTRLDKRELYKLTAKIAEREFSNRDIALEPGTSKKFFASAITPTGFHNHIKTLIKDYRRIYFFAVPVGADTGATMSMLAREAHFRGLDTEKYYCPMKPDSKAERLLIPEISVAFMSLNEYHDINPGEIICNRKENTPEISLIDFKDLLFQGQVDRRKLFIKTCEETIKNLLQEGVNCIAKAKKEHDRLESYYIPHMDFKKIDALRDEIIAKMGETVL